MCNWQRTMCSHVYTLETSLYLLFTTRISSNKIIPIADLHVSLFTSQDSYQSTHVDFVALSLFALQDSCQSTHVHIADLSLPTLHDSYQFKHVHIADLQCIVTCFSGLVSFHTRTYCRPILICFAGLISVGV